MVFKITLAQLHHMQHASQREESVTVSHPMQFLGLLKYAMCRKMLRYSVEKVLTDGTA
jgi:hypothetical protein